MIKKIQNTEKISTKIHVGWRIVSGESSTLLNIQQPFLTENQDLVKRDIQT